MDPQSLLEQLEPLRTPPPVGWWPPALGWWLVTFLALAVLLLLARWMWARWRAGEYRRDANKQLERWSRQPEAVTLAQINRLLKATALKAWPSDVVASLSDANWVEFLEASTVGKKHTEFAVLRELYKTPSMPAPNSLIDSARDWIHFHRVKPLDQSSIPTQDAAGGSRGA
jgi:hypothetical protein